MAAVQIIGIDISKRRFHATWLRDPENERVRSKAFDNTPAGHAQLLKWATHHSQCEPTHLHVVLEATGVYHKALAEYVYAAGCRVSVVNPLHVRRFAESRGSRGKNDQHDGRMLALFGHERRPALWHPPAPEARELQALLKRLEALEADHVREANRLEKAQVEHAPQPVIASLQAMLGALEAQIEHLHQQIDDHIDRHPELKHSRELLETVPGIGPKLSAWFLALFTLKSFDCARQAAAFLGLAPAPYESGTSVYRPPRLPRTGDARWRARLYLPALTALQHNRDIRALFERLTGAGKCKKSAVAAAMRKLVHIAFGVFKHQQPYRPQVG